MGRPGEFLLRDGLVFCVMWLQPRRSGAKLPPLTPLASAGDGQAFCVLVVCDGISNMRNPVTEALRAPDEDPPPLLLLPLLIYLSFPFSWLLPGLSHTNTPLDLCFLQPSSVCCFCLIIGQRRLWEAVKRRKAMCKRKSWMSKVTHTHAHIHTRGFPPVFRTAFLSRVPALLV